MSMNTVMRHEHGFVMLPIQPSIQNMFIILADVSIVHTQKESVG